MEPSASKRASAGRAWRYPLLPGIGSSAGIPMRFSLAGVGYHGPPRALRGPELVRVRIWNDRPADLAPRVEENDLTSMRIAETVREVLIEVTPVTSRQRRRHAERSLPIAGKDQAGQAEHPHDHEDRQQNSERNQDAPATQAPA